MKFFRSLLMRGKDGRMPGKQTRNPEESQIETELAKLFAPDAQRWIVMRPINSSGTARILVRWKTIGVDLVGCPGGGKKVKSFRMSENVQKFAKILEENCKNALFQPIFGIEFDGIELDGIEFLALSQTEAC